MTRIVINGFGRIGRIFFRTLRETKDLEVVAINDLVDSAALAHLLKYDSVHGRYPGEVEAKGDLLYVDGKPIKVFSERDPQRLPWKDLQVAIAVECSGKLTDREGASKHLAAGAARVLISAPAKSPDATLVMGVNHDSFDPAKHKIISNASCTTNALAVVAKVLLDEFGIERGWMTTVHSYTNDQQLLDLPHKDPRRARAAALSMIPTSTGAARALFEVLPALKGKVDGMAIRVPTPNVSVIDFVCQVSRDTTKEEVNTTMKAASEGRLAGFLGYSEEPLVSVDYNGDPRSGIVDGLLTAVTDRCLVQVVAWYDNEWGYSCRLRDMTRFIGGCAST